MKKSKKNSIDILIEKLSSEFSNIPNFHLVNSDPDANELFNFIVRRFGELSDFETLYLNYYIPASSKAIIESYDQFRKSTYRNVIQVTKDDLKDNYFETIRLGYVGLFHKVENFMKELIILSNKHFNNHDESKTSIQKFILEKFSFNIEKDWKIEGIYIEKINWICNCIKHRDGYPLLKTNSVFAIQYPKSEKFKIEKNEFKEDIQYIREFYLQKTKEVILLGVYKSMQETYGTELEYHHLENNENIKIFENLVKLEESIRQIIELKNKSTKN